MKFELNNFTMNDLLKIFNKFSNVTGKLGYAIARAKSRIMIELRPFEEQRDALIMKYGTEDENGMTSVQPDSENYQEFVNELVTIGQLTASIEVMQVSREEFDKTDIYSDECSARDYEVIETIFVEKEENDN